MKGWKVTTVSRVPGNGFNDIMSEQLAQGLQDSWGSVPQGETEEVDEDLLLAQALQAQFNDEIEQSSSAADDLVIAQLLQASEDEDRAIERRQVRDTEVFRKVTVGSADGFNAREINPINSVHSSGWVKAVKLEKSLGNYDEEKQAALSKHDPLISALRYSDALTEIEGAGDLSGSGLLVSRSVGYSLENFAKKQRKLKGARKAKDGDKVSTKAHEKVSESIEK